MRTSHTSWLTHLLHLMKVFAPLCCSVYTVQQGLNKSFTDSWAVCSLCFTDKGQLWVASETREGAYRVRICGRTQDLSALPKLTQETDRFQFSVTNRRYYLMLSPSACSWGDCWICKKVPWDNFFEIWCYMNKIESNKILAR